MLTLCFSLDHSKSILGWGLCEVVLPRGSGWTGIQSTRVYGQWAAFFIAQAIQTKCDKWAESHKYSSSSLP